MSAAPQSTDQRWICPNCGRRYRLAAGKPVPALCADCRRRQELGVEDEDPEFAELLASPGAPKPGGAARRGALSSSTITTIETGVGGYVGANPGVLKVVIVAAALILIMLWFDTASSLARIGAAGLIAAVIWSAYLLVSARWPSEKRLERIIAIVATPLAIYLYFMTAREIVVSTSANGRYSSWETRTWTGRPLRRRVAGKGTVAEGPLNAGGERHGVWRVWPGPPGRQKIWFWNGEEVTEEGWRHRNR
jgi:hypothetical protein